MDAVTIKIIVIPNIIIIIRLDDDDNEPTNTTGFVVLWRNILFFAKSYRDFIYTFFNEIVTDK